MDTYHGVRSGTEKGGGGLVIFYRDNLKVHRHKPEVPHELEYIQNERQWLLLHDGAKKCAFLHCYLACQTTRNDSYLRWNEDLFFLMKEEAKVLKQQGFMVLAMGDFNTRVGRLPGLEENTPDTNDNFPMFSNFLNETNLLIINTLPVAKGVFTRFMTRENRRYKSVLDYGLIGPELSNTVTSFVIDANARFKTGSDHALLTCCVNFGLTPRITWDFREALQYKITDQTDFTDFRASLDSMITTIHTKEFGSLSADEMLPHISETINKVAEKTLGFKVLKKKKGRKLPQPILKMISQKGELASNLHKGMYDHDKTLLRDKRADLDKLKQQIDQQISSMKLRQRARLRSKLLLADPTKKKFWRFLKDQFKSAGTISALKDSTDKMVFEQHEIEDVVLQHFNKIFNGSPVPVDQTTSHETDQVKLCIQEIDEMLVGLDKPQMYQNFDDVTCAPYTFSELGDLLNNLPNNKASGFGVRNLQPRINIPVATLELCLRLAKLERTPTFRSN